MEPIKNIILEKINAGEIAMRPRWSFVLKTILLVTGIIILALTIIYLTSFIIFMLEYTGAIYIPTFGMAGALPFLLSVPWTLLGLSLLFIIILEFLVHKFSFAYRKPLLYSVFGIVLLVICGSYAVLQSSLHNRLEEISIHGSFPIVGSFYHNFGDAPVSSVSFGEVIKLAPNSLVLNDPKQGRLQVSLMKISHINKTSIELGDMVLIFGGVRNGAVVAHGIRVINNNLVLPLPQHQIQIHMQLTAHATTTH